MKRSSQILYPVNLYRLNTYAVVIFVLLFGKVQFAKAQLGNSVYENFSQTIFNPYLINPSATDTTFAFRLQFNNLNELGLLKNVNRFYLEADKKFSSEKGNEFHYAGIQLINSNLGDYISESRLNFRYSWFNPLSKKAALSAGVSLGFINYSFLTTQGGSGGTDYGPDGSLGIHYLRPGFSLGVAMQQIFTPVLIPVNQSFRLKRLYNFDVSKGFNFSPQFYLEGQGVIQFSEDQSWRYSLGLISTLFQNYKLGLSNYMLRKTSVSGGFRYYAFSDYKLSLITTFSFYHNTIHISDNTLEVLLIIAR